MQNKNIILVAKKKEKNEIIYFFDNIWPQKLIMFNSILIIINFSLCYENQLPVVKSSF